MRVVYHPDFVHDLRKFEQEYRNISDGLGERFHQEVLEAIAAIKAAPERAGHFLQTGSAVVHQFRRRNLRAFPFFVLYGATADSVYFGSLIPSRSDPVTWLTRFA